MCNFFKSILVLTIMLCAAHAYGQAPINSNAALQPSEGGLIIRQQFRYFEAGSDPSPLRREVESFVAATTIVYGVKSEFAVIVTAPFVFRKIDVGLTGASHRDEGFADLTAMAKIRLFRNDFGPTNTQRFDVLAGLEIRSGDSNFSSDSYDPIIGAVFTHVQDRHTFSADFLWKFNTGGGAASVDRARYDAAYMFRISPKQYTGSDPTALFAVLELNGTYETNGDNEVFISPGIQFATRKFVIEATVQLPIWQNLDNRLEKDFVVGVGFRLIF